MDWELTKENFIPVRQGRTEVTLRDLADPTLEPLEAKRRELWSEITDYKGEDPLEPWQRYIKWMQEYGVGSGKADLLKVLEACTKELQKHPRYKSDIRFLRIWVQYADCLPDPEDVFMFLKEKGIGCEFALYYEAYATYFELKGNFRAADAVYTDGIQRGVKQLERLKQKHAAFQHRMAQRVQRQIMDAQAMGPPPEEPVRSNLAAIGPRGPARGHQQQQGAGGVFGVAAATQEAAGLFGHRPINPAQHQRGVRPLIGIHEDDEFAGSENPRPGLPGYSMMPQVNNARELQPYGVRRKENLDRALAWNQAGLLPSATSATAAGPPAGVGGGLEIHTDEEFQEGDYPSARTGPGQQHRGCPPAATGPSADQPLLQLAAADRSASGAVPDDADALMLRLAGPRTLLQGLPPGPKNSVSESIASMSISGPRTAVASGAIAAQQLPAQPHASLGAAGLPVRHTDSGGLAFTHSAMPFGTDAAVSASTAVPTEGASCIQEAGVPEEMSYEERRAVVWFRHNPGPWQKVLSTAGVGKVIGVGISAEAHCAVQLAPTERKPSDVPKQPLAVLNGSREAEDSATLRGAGVACGAGRVGLAAVGSGPRRAAFGQVLSALAAGTGAGLPAQKLHDSSCVQSNENGLSGGPSAGHQQRRPLADTASAVARAPLGQPASGSACSISLRCDTSRSNGLQVQPLQREPSGCSGASEYCDSDHKHEDAQHTISTRGAFDVINSLFSEDLPHQHTRADREAPRSRSSRKDSVLPSQAPAPAAELMPPRPQPQARHSSAFHDPKQPVTVEPTVTFHTKLAFDAVNDMFCDRLPHEEARKPTNRTAPNNGAGGVTNNVKSTTASDICQLSNGAFSSAATAPDAGRRNLPCGAVTDNFSGTHSGGRGLATKSQSAHAFAGPAPSLDIHEDTFFLGPAPPPLPDNTLRGSIGGNRQRAAPGLDRAFNPPVYRPEPASIYEDTEFIPRRADVTGSGSAAHSGSAFILEDTEFVTQHHGSNMAASGLGGIDREIVIGGSRAALAPAATLSRSLSSGGSRDLCAPRAGSRGAGNSFQPLYGSKSALQVYEDTQYKLDE